MGAISAPICGLFCANLRENYSTLASKNICGKQRYCDQFHPSLVKTVINPVHTGITRFKKSTTRLMTTTTASRTIENPIIKDKVTFLETAAETQGKYTRVQVELAPGGGNQVHFHKTFDESFTVVEGTLGIQLGLEFFELEAGASATAPAGILHRFYNPSETETVVFNVLVQPGSPGFEKTLQVAYGLARDGRVTRKGVPKNLYHMALIVQWSDTNIPGLFSLLEPALRWMARRAVRKGIDRELEATYCLI